MTRLVLLAACAFTCAALVSPPESADDVDTLIQAGLAKHAIPGAALAIGQKGVVIKSAGYGTAGAVAMTADTPLYIGSQSKSFTALAILQLAEDGKLSLDDPVRAHIPSFQIADEAASARITPRHLLNHTSGMSEQGYVEYLPESASLDDQVRDLSRAALTAPVGAQMAYFNPGYAVLGRVIEAASGRSYGDFLRERIFQPLRMSRTFTDRAVADRAGLAEGYSQMFGFPIPLAQTHRTYGVPEGYIMSTANDMLRYLMALNNGGEPVKASNMGWRLSVAPMKRQRAWPYARSRRSRCVAISAVVSRSGRSASEVVSSIASSTA